MGTRTARAQALTQTVDVGDVVTAGGGTHQITSGVYTVTGAGLGLGGAADACHFAFGTVTGNGELVARAVSLPGGAPASQSGLLLRESLDPAARSVALVISPGGNVTLLTRTATGGTMAGTSAGSLPLPGWLKLSRTGGAVSAFTSTDGLAWTPVGSVNLSATATTVCAGLAVTSASTTTTGTASFDQVSSTLLPADGLQLWLRADAGVTLDGAGMVSDWANQSPVGGNPLGQNDGARRPQLVANAINGLPALRFNGSGVVLTAPNTVLSGASAASAFVVTSVPDLNTQGAFLFVGADNGFALGVGDSTYAGTGNHLIGVFSHVRWLPTSTALGLGPVIAEMIVDGAGTTNFYRNGVHAGSDAGGGPRPAMGNIEIGGPVYRGDVAETLVYNRALNPAERGIVEGYLNSRWGMVPLPAQPVGLSAAGISSTQALLAWNVSAGTPPAQKWKVERKRSPAGSYAQIAEVAGGDVRAYLDQGLDPGASYTYRLRAGSLAGFSLPSDEATVTLPTPLGAAAALPAAANLVLWLRPETGISKDPGNDLVNGWNDSSGRGHNAAPTGAAPTSRPLWSGALFNGRPALRFDGVNHSLSVPVPVSTAAGNATLLAVASVPDSASHGVLVKLGSGPSGFGFGPGSGYLDYPGNHAIGIYEGVRWIDTGKALGTGLILAGMSVDAGGTATFFRNGESLGSYPGPAPIPPATSTLIGGQPGARMFRGDLGEVLVFNRALSDAERRAWEDYLSAKYYLGFYHVDTDGDGLGDWQERYLGTNPLLTDTNGDGLSDQQDLGAGYSATMPNPNLNRPPDYVPPPGPPAPDPNDHTPPVITLLQPLDAVPVP